MDLSNFGKTLMAFGGGIALLGLLLFLGSKLKGGFPLLPGDIYINKGQVKIYFPIVTGLLVSVVLTVLLNLIGRFGR